MASIGRDRRRHWVEQRLAEVPGLGSERRRALSVPLMESGWHALVSETNPLGKRADAFLVGRSGIYALVFSDEVPGESVLRAIRTHAEETLADLQFDRRAFVPHMVQVVVVLPREIRWADGRIRVVDEATLRAALGGGKVLDGKRSRLLVEAIALRLSDYILISTDDAPTPESTATEGLFTGEELHEHERERVLRRPFAEWMTFLDPEQLALVHRNFNGPARLSGPAGTGKTVVALHRMARFAKQNSGRMLFTSFVRTLPAYHRSGFQRIAPHVEDRAEFEGLHAWAIRFLRDRGIMPPLDVDGCENAKARIWVKHARSALSEIKGTGQSYWSDELDRVIKGRGIATLEQYQSIERMGRNRVRLGPAGRETVWRSIYLPYQQWLEEHRICDFNDLFRCASEELKARPLAEPYGLVVVDEVQDFTLTELRLVHQIAGGRPDSQLLFVGDGQQQVYPGGWRLSDAGIPIVGRGAVLRVNYRNRAAVHDYAKAVDATNTVDDLDGGAGVVLRDSDVVLPGGEAEAVTGNRREVEAKLVEAVKSAQSRRADLAVLVATTSEADRLRRILTKSEIPTCPLTHYDGTQHNEVKVGTVHRAKGMDFAGVFHLSVRPRIPIAELDGAERDRADLDARQTMVALTRARDYIWIGVVEG
ncbi:UvrD-helicase domain-containing protein [Nocardia sp. NPDC058658]|uniref:UvrD-helicase domain-containing protein n=1 Tax=Nocardia sp. NPDC058658 TaxID=3346580 RepID=UPI003656D0E0